MSEPAPEREPDHDDTVVSVNCETCQATAMATDFTWLAANAILASYPDGWHQPDCPGHDLGFVLVVLDGDGTVPEIQRPREAQ